MGRVDGHYLPGERRVRRPRCATAHHDRSGAERRTLRRPQRLDATPAHGHGNRRVAYLPLTQVERGLLVIGVDFLDVADHRTPGIETSGRLTSTMLPAVSRT